MVASHNHGTANDNNNNTNNKRTSLPSRQLPKDYHARLVYGFTLCACSAEIFQKRASLLLNSCRFFIHFLHGSCLTSSGCPHPNLPSPANQHFISRTDLVLPLALANLVISFSTVVSPVVTTTSDRAHLNAHLNIPRQSRFGAISSALLPSRSGLLWRPNYLLLILFYLIIEGL